MPTSKYNKAAALPLTPTTLGTDTTIPNGYQMVVFGTLTIPSGVTLTIESGGQLIVTNLVLNGAVNG